MARSELKRYYKRIERLDNLRDYTAKKVIIAELNGHDPAYAKGQLSALEWAIPILKQYVSDDESERGNLYWLREYNLLLERNNRLFGDTLASSDEIDKP